MIEENDENIKEFKRVYDMIHELFKVNNVLNDHAINALTHYLLDMCYSMEFSPEYVKQVLTYVYEEYQRQYEEKNKV